MVHTKVCAYNSQGEIECFKREVTATPLPLPLPPPPPPKDAYNIDWIRYNKPTNTNVIEMNTSPILFQDDKMLSYAPTALTSFDWKPIDFDMNTLG